MVQMQILRQKEKKTTLIGIKYACIIKCMKIQTNDLKTLKQPCELTNIIECDPEYRDKYRNKVEFTIGRRYQDNAICVGFNTGNLSKGITFVDYPDGIKTNSAESV